jgi:hypothetical protein
LTVQGLQGIPWPAPAAMPGRVIECRDEPIEPDELAGVTNATELGLLLGISRQAAHKRIAKRAAAAAGPSCASPIRVIREPDSCAVPEFFTHLTPDA